MKITPQDIIDKEFRVKFRGFDMTEVDTFLEELAENFFKLTEENTRLNEKILALQKDLESGAVATVQTQFELPPEVSNFLDDLKQDTAAISAEITALKQDRQTFLSLEKSFKEATASLQKAAASTPPPQDPAGLPADLDSALEEFKKGAGAINVELASLKEERQAFDALKKSLEEAVASIIETVTAKTAEGLPELPANMAKTMEEFRRGTETVATEMAALKQELGSLQQHISGDIKAELQNLLTSQFAVLAEQLQAAPATLAGSMKPAEAAGEKKPPLAAAIIEKEPEGLPEDSRLPDFEAEDDTDADGELEFLSEDDILNVDKLRDVFQSVLDESISDGHNSREDDDDASADLLFLEDDLFEDEHEPEVTFSLDEEKTGNTSKSSKESGKT